jgi:hypothetical protein
MLRTNPFRIHGSMLRQKVRRSLVSALNAFLVNSHLYFATIAQSRHNKWRFAVKEAGEQGYSNPALVEANFCGVKR